MTHKPLIDPQHFHFNSCWIDRFPSNNGVVLQWAPNGKGDHRTKTLMFLSGSDIGTDQNDSDETVLARAIPIFQAILFAHNRALEMGGEQGRSAAQAKMREALGIKP